MVKGAAGKEMRDAVDKNDGKLFSTELTHAMLSPFLAGIWNLEDLDPLQRTFIKDERANIEAICENYFSARDTKWDDQDPKIEFLRLFRAYINQYLTSVKSYLTKKR